MVHNPINPDNQPGKIHQKPDISIPGNEEVKKKDTLNKSALVYETMAQLAALGTAAKENAPIQGVVPSVGEVGRLTGAKLDLDATIDHFEEVADHIQEYNQSFKDKEYQTNPQAFFEKLLKAGIDITQTEPKEIRDVMMNDLMSRLGSFGLDEESKKAFGVALAAAYQKISGSSEDIGQLKAALVEMFGANDPKGKLTNKIAQMYSDSVSGGKPLAGLGKSSEILASGLKGNESWQDKYDELMRQLAKGIVNFDLMMEVFENAPAGSGEMMKKLAIMIKPLIGESAGRGAFARMLSLYFARAGDEEGSLKRAEDFIKSLMPYYIDDMDNYEDDPFYEHIYALLESTKAKMTSEGGPFAPDGGMTQDEIDADLKAGQKLFNDAVGGRIKMANVIRTMPILMAMYMALMSSEGSYGYLAKIMGTTNATLKKVGEFTDKMQDINDKLREFMDADDAADWKRLAAELGETRQELMALLKADEGLFDDSFTKRFDDFLKYGGTLDGPVENSGQPHKNWEWLGKEGSEEELKKVHNYLTGGDGGSLPAATTALVQNISNIIGYLNTQNQGHLEKLNMTTKKVDSLTKLFSAAITMHKGLTQTLTQFSGA